MQNLPTTVQGTALNDMFFAINHYLSTSEYIGSGLAIEDGDSVIAMVLYDPSNPTDSDDWARFVSRLREVATPHTLSAESEARAIVPNESAEAFARHINDSRPIGMPPLHVHRTPKRFVHATLRIKKGDIAPFTYELLSSGGKRGFGSDYPKIQAVFAGEREAMLRRLAKFRPSSST